MSQEPSTLPRWADLVDDPSDSDLDALTARLAELDGPADESGDWPADLWAALEHAGAVKWSIPPEFAGEGVERLRLAQRYARVAEGSLTAAFILSQHDAGVRRLASAADRPCAREWLSKVSAGQAFTTVGISQLTTSRRLGDQPMKAVETAGGGFRLDGVMPWVTAAEQADVLVTGAVTPDGLQVLAALPTDRPGLSVRPPFALAALQASRTTEVVCEGVEITPDDLLAGPTDDVMTHTNAAGTGGLETSALALGQARAALAALSRLTPQRSDLAETLEALEQAWAYTWNDLAAAATGHEEAPTPGQVRGRSNALVLRAAQALLAARKGSGFLRPDPAQRWSRQALFFLVWSCPSPVARATLHDLCAV